uniref:Squalene synthase n=1 Tax=Eptatretus burgeri TaxID=7764 RepID=A0A8C4WX21_EPTBU
MFACFLGNSIIFFELRVLFVKYYKICGWARGESYFNVMDLLKSLGHPEEVFNLLWFKMRGCNGLVPKTDMNNMSNTLRTCYLYLDQTSRSFAAVIRALDGELRDAVCIFYLVLRALDTLEDSSSIPYHIKAPLLQSFHTRLYQPLWNYSESCEKDRQVLEDFSTISLEFRKLALVYRDIITDICWQMGEGMAEMLESKLFTMDDWERVNNMIFKPNLYCFPSFLIVIILIFYLFQYLNPLFYQPPQYCHYVAGLVGIGLSQLFAASGQEEEVIREDTELANSMGLFLQKTNIIRDYLEDQQEGREFWPKEVWGKYAKTLSEFTQRECMPAAVSCLNELVTNAMQHIPDVFTYLSHLHNPDVFTFCAIPQVMAIATLAACYNNTQVFRGVVKIRKGLAVTLMMEAKNMTAVKDIMARQTLEIAEAIKPEDPSASETHHVVKKVLRLAQSEDQDRLIVKSRWTLCASSFLVSCALIVAIVSWHYLATLKDILAWD